MLPKLTIAGDEQKGSSSIRGLFEPNRLLASLQRNIYVSADEREFLLSVAIPTKNRQVYLVSLVDELLLSDRQDFEIVIQDNSDDDRLAAYVAELNDRRVRYAYHAGWMSVVDNCDAAVRACAGDYVCMLGDDDGIMLEEALTLLADAKADGVEALMSQVLLYTWPDLSHHSINNLGGKLYCTPLVHRKEGADALALARRVVARGGALGLEGLPSVYQGFVGRTLLSAVEAKTGSHFPGPSPDMANAIGIGAFLKRCRFVSTVLVIAGHSGPSGAGQGAMRQHCGAIAAQRHLPLDTAENWYPQIPFFWSGPTIYAQSLRCAIARTETTALGTPKDACLYAACFIFDPSYARETWRALRLSDDSLWEMVPEMVYYASVIMLKRARHLMNNLIASFLPDRATIRAETIAEAIRVARTLPR